MNIYILDVGTQQYGDCILLVHEGRRILIDGGHPRDADLISGQLATLLGPAPHRIDLLVVTHCHADHYGCLPELVSTEVIDVQRALVADETLGWPLSRQPDDAAGAADATAPAIGSARHILNEALLEEPLTDATDAEIARFLQDAMSGEEKYKQMLDAIPRVTRYGTASNRAIRGIEQEFVAFGLKVLGPTVDHLRICADFIYQESRRRRDDALESDAAATPEELVDLYRREVSRKMAVVDGAADAIDAEDRMGAGSARNNQSIVLKVSADGFSALLAGDMQFAAAEVPGLDDAMTVLREKVRAAGPYDFVKLTHHSSYNGVDDSVLADYPGCLNFAHTGGLYDATHPDPGVLEILAGRSEDIYFARTDRNGLITITKSGDRMRMQVERGTLNNFQRNRSRPRPRPDILPQPIVSGTEAIIAERWNREYIEVTAKIPHRATRVTLTIEIEPEKKKPVTSPQTARPDEPIDRPPPEVQGPPGTPQGGQTGRFSRLLFITSPQVLGENIGRTEANQALNLIRTAGGRLLQVDRGLQPDVIAQQARAVLQGGTFKGVVILGGPDVVPSERLNVIDDGLRQRVDDFLIRTRSDDDADDFIVWSDDLYGDIEGDRFAELPVSRIPDGRKASLVMAALSSSPQNGAARMGVRNIDRPFAEAVFRDLPGTEPLRVSQPTNPQALAGTTLSGSVYFMLHGLDSDGTRYWGENGNNRFVEAIDVSNVPRDAKGSVLFLGCCWGALATLPTAKRATGEYRIRPRTSDQSIALAYLEAGVSAVVGCTGTHYSPDDGLFDYFGQPMHVQFWRRIAAGSPPAKALFEAKAAYAPGIPHGPRDPFSEAIELKIWRQYSCLGLGW